MLTVCLTLFSPLQRNATLPRFAALRQRCLCRGLPRLRRGFVDFDGGLRGFVDFDGGLRGFGGFDGGLCGFGGFDGGFGEAAEKLFNYVDGDGE